MKLAFQINEHTDELVKHSGWFIFWGICLVLLGMGAIYISVFTTLATVILLGIMLAVVGAFMLVDTFKFWHQKGMSFATHLIQSILYLIVAGLLIFAPMAGAISITLLLGIFFLVMGIYRLIFALSLKFPRWGWMLFNGIITAILGILILSQWPASGLYIIGLFVGIDILLIGWTYIMLGIFSRSIAKNV